MLVLFLQFVFMRHAQKAMLIIGHFLVPQTLTFKTRLSAKPFLCKWVLFVRGFISMTWGKLEMTYLWNNFAASSNEAVNSSKRNRWRDSDGFWKLWVTFKKFWWWRISLCKTLLSYPATFLVYHTKLMAWSGTNPLYKRNNKQVCVCTHFRLTFGLLKSSFVLLDFFQSPVQPTK